MIGCLVASLALCLMLPPAAARAHGAPRCEMLTFHGLPTGKAYPTQVRAGFYRSHNGLLELMADGADAGTPSYALRSRGKPLAPLRGKVPAAAVACARQKGMPPPAHGVTSCTGGHLAAIVARPASQAVGLLYARDRGAWHFCSAGLLVP